MKRWGLGTYHGLRRKHIDTYLNEFVFRYNRRFYRHVSFETLLPGRQPERHQKIPESTDAGYRSIYSSPAIRRPPFLRKRLGDLASLMKSNFL
jgi:hypothetical protein